MPWNDHDYITDLIPQDQRDALRFRNKERPINHDEAQNLGFSTQVKFGEFTEIDFPPPGLESTGVGFRTGPPKQLRELTEVTATYDYSPENVKYLYEKLHETKNITMFFGHPICAVSRSYKAYPAKNVKEFAGYLSKFEPEYFQQSDGTMAASIRCEIIPTEEPK